jgi:hypothetical protein
MVRHQKDRTSFGSFYYRFPQGLHSVPLRALFFTKSHMWVFILNLVATYVRMCHVVSCFPVCVYGLGESGADVYVRVSVFLQTFFDQLKRAAVDSRVGPFARSNICIVSHGLFIRLFLTRFFYFSVEEFSDLWNLVRTFFCFSFPCCTPLLARLCHALTALFFSVSFTRLSKLVNPSVCVPISL